LLPDRALARMLIVSTLQMPAQQRKVNMRRLVEHSAAAIALAALMALLIPASVAPLNDQAMAGAITSNAGVATSPTAAATADGRWKLGGDGSCYWDPDDSGPDQCAQPGRWKLGDDGTCYWDADDAGANQCEPPAEAPAVEARAISHRTAFGRGV